MTTTFRRIDPDDPRSSYGRRGAVWAVLVDGTDVGTLSRPYGTWWQAIGPAGIRVAGQKTRETCAADLIVHLRETRDLLASLPI